MPLFSVEEARNFDKQQLKDVQKYPDAMIEAEADRIADFFRSVCGVAFEPTTATNETIDGPDCSTTLWLRYLPIISVTTVATRSGTVWTDFTSDELADLVILPEGGLLRDMLGRWPNGRQNIRVTYQHGFETTPLDIKRAALKVVVDSTVGLIPTNMLSRAMSYSDESGTYRLTTPGIGNTITGIPEVDYTLNLYRSAWLRPLVA